MARDFRVTGAENLARAGTALRKQGTAGKGARREMKSTIQSATKPLRFGVKASARATLPRRGGLAAEVARSSVTTQTKDRGRSVGIRLIARGKKGVIRDVASTDRGRLRHPVFARPGQPRVWVNQTVTPGWWTKPLEAFAPKVRKELAKALDKIARDVARSTRR